MMKEQTRKPVAGQGTLVVGTNRSGLSVHGRLGRLAARRLFTNGKQHGGR